MQGRREITRHMVEIVDGQEPVLRMYREINSWKDPSGYELLTLSLCSTIFLKSSLALHLCLLEDVCLVVMIVRRFLQSL